MATSATRKRSLTSSNSFLHLYGWDLLLGLISAFYVFMVPYTKVEESFNVQAMHDILHHRHHLEKYDHFEFPGVVRRTFVGSVFISLLASPTVLVFRLSGLPKIYDLLAVRLALADHVKAKILGGMDNFHNLAKVIRKFGFQVEAFFVMLTACQFHLLFYSTRPLPNILSLGLVNLAYGFWLKGNYLAVLSCLTLTTVVFRCDTVLLLGPIGLCLLLTKSVSLWEAFKCCIATSIIGIGLSVLVDTVMWQTPVWPELEVFWFNSVLNRSSEWGTHPFHWYFTSALPRSLLVAYPLALVGVLVDRRIIHFVLPVFSFILLYSKLPHKELRFIIGSVPLINLSAAIAASRIYNNRRKKVWNLLYIVLVGFLLGSLGWSVITFKASYENYPSAYALRDLHKIIGHNDDTTEQRIHIDSFAAMNGISRFCEKGLPWSYSKEEGILVEDLSSRNFTYLINEHARINGFKCLFAVDGFSRVSVRVGFPPLLVLKEPKVYVHGNVKDRHIANFQWPGCPP